MAKPNYSFEKRQRDLAKKQKKEEKRLRKQGTANTTAAPDGEQAAESDAAISNAAPLTEPPTS